jgi:hypothetical protein
LFKKIGIFISNKIWLIWFLHVDLKLKDFEHYKPFTGTQHSKKKNWEWHCTFKKSVQHPFLCWMLNVNAIFFFAGNWLDQAVGCKPFTICSLTSHHQCSQVPKFGYGLNITFEKRFINLFLSVHDQILAFLYRIYIPRKI